MALQEYLQAIAEQDARSPTREMTVFESRGRHDAVRRMLEFGDKYRLSPGEPITRRSLHEGHRF
jgi:hypothetical protein